MKFTTATTAALLVLASVVSASSVGDIKQEVATIKEKVKSLNEHLHVSSLNYFNGFAIRHSTQEVITSIQAGSKSMDEFKGTPTDADAKEILQSLAYTETDVKAAVQRMIVLKKEFEKLGVATLAAGSINQLKTETLTFSAQLVKAAPAHEKEAAKALAAKFNKDLNDCAAVYSGEASGSASSKFSGAGKAGAKEASAQAGVIGEVSGSSQAEVKSGSKKAVAYGSN